MKYEIKEISSIKRKAEVEVTPEEFDNYYAEALREIVKDVELPGFRKGKAPENLVEEKLNPATVLSEASEHAIRDNWIKIIKETKIEVVSPPQVEIVKVAKGNPFIFNAEFEIIPEIKLPDLQSIGKGIKREEVKVEDKEVEDTLNWLQQSRAKFSEKESGAEKTDLVEFSFSCLSIKDDAVKKDRIVLGKGHYIEGLEDVITGMKRGEEKEFETVNPQEKKEKLTLRVKVDSVKKMELPEINDEWAKSLGHFGNIAALKEDIKKGIKQEKEIAEKQKQREQAINKILEKVKFEVPQILIEREVEMMIENVKSRVQSELGMAYDQYLSQIKKTEEDVKKEFEKIAGEKVKGFLVLNQIVKDEKIQVEEKEIEEKIEEIINQYPDKEEARKGIDMEHAKVHIEDELKREKIFQLFGC
ncbi:MAG: trigger factor [Candidatus Paceibacterota bacterium]|jgi:trigger factor